MSRSGQVRKCLSKNKTPKGYNNKHYYFTFFIPFQNENIASIFDEVGHLIWLDQFGSWWWLLDYCRITIVGGGGHRPDVTGLMA